jgi:hypothetical protein
MEAKHNTGWRWAPYSPRIRGADESAVARFLGATGSAPGAARKTILIPARRENPGPSKMRLGS